MNVQTTSYVYSGFAGVAIAVVSGIAATAISEPRFEHVSSLVDDGDKVDGLSEVVGMRFVGDCILLSSQGDNCLTILSQAEDGGLSMIEHIARDRQGGVPKGARKIPHDQAARVGGGSICTTKDGRFVFIASLGSILLFERTADEGLNFLGYHGHSGIVGKTGFKQAGFIRCGLSPDETFLFANRLTDSAVEVIAFHRDEKAMASVEIIPNLGSWTEVALTPDGKHLYVLSRLDGLLHCFEVSPEHGTLTKLRELTAKDCGLGTFKVATMLEIAPDGATVLIASGMNEGETAILTRDANSGELTVAQTIDQERLNNPDFNRAACAAFTPDSRTLFLGCDTSQCVVVLRKDDASGKFSYLETIKHPTIERPTCLAVNNGFLYVCSRKKGMIAVFRINDKDKARAE